jgi:hypothetical protein
VKIAVLHVNKSSINSTSPTMRIAKYVASRIPEVSFVYDIPTAESVKDVEFDVVFVKYGMLAFSDHRKEALRLHNTAKRVVSLENDYAFEADKRFRKADEVWSTVEGRTHYVNWNVLTRHGTEGWEKKSDFRDMVNSGLLYYGAYRPGRVDYFRKYFIDAPYPLTVSSFKGEKNFGVLAPNARLIPAFRDPDAPSEWEMTLYMEDDRSHDLYCSPANRFYECVHMGLPQVIDAKAVATLTKGGIDVPEEFIVDSRWDVRRALQHAVEVRGDQQKLWRRDYAADLHDQFDAAMTKSKIS